MAARGLPPPLGAELPNDNPELFRGAVWRPPTPCAAPRAWREPEVQMLYYPGTPRALRPEMAARGTPATLLDAEPPAGTDVSPSLRLDGGSQSEAGKDIGVEADHSTPEKADTRDTEPGTSDSINEAPSEAPRFFEVRSENGDEACGSGPSDFDRFVKSLVQVAMGRGATRAAAELQKFLETQELRGQVLVASARNALIERGFCADDAGTLRPTPSFEAVLSSWRRALSGQEHDLDSAGDETLDQWASSLLGAWLGCEQEKLPTLRRALRKSGVLAFGMRAA